jgi:hypothetical protein
VYALGETGPAGGKIFYDKGYYSEGWRFLEAAPADLEGKYAWGGALSAGVVENYCLEGVKYIMAWNFDDNYPRFKGKENTEELVTHDHGEQHTQIYQDGDTHSWGPGAHDAARACADYGNGADFDDWFLPSWDELRLLWEQWNATKTVTDGVTVNDTYPGFAATEGYWSSSPSESLRTAYYINFSVGHNADSPGNYKYWLYKVRPVRRF